MFHLSDKEWENAYDFEAIHKHTDTYKGAIGGHITYIFTPNSIGCNILIQCYVCKEEEDLTDYDSW